MKNWHIIKEYKAIENLITCVCGWFGDAGDSWLDHRRINKTNPAPKGFNKKDYVYAAGSYYVTIKKDVY